MRPLESSRTGSPTTKRARLQAAAENVRRRIGNSRPADTLNARIALSGTSVDSCFGDIDLLQDPFERRRIT